MKKRGRKEEIRRKKAKKAKKAKKTNIVGKEVSRLFQNGVRLQIAFVVEKEPWDPRYVSPH